MTDKLHHDDQAVPKQAQDKAAQSSSTNISEVWARQYGHQQPEEQYRQKDIEAARKFAEGADKLLGRLEIDHKPGISRAEIIAAAGKKNVSEQDSKIYAGLNNMEPSVQEAWQVPNHRQHLKEHADAEFLRSAARLVKMGGDKSWAGELQHQADKVDAVARKELAGDSKKQSQVYFKEGGVNAAKLGQLKDQIDRVEVALQVLPNADRRATDLLKKFDPQGHGLTPVDLENIVRNDRGKLSFADRTLLQAVANYQKHEQQNLQEQGLSSRSGPKGENVYTYTRLNAGQVAETLKSWAVGETRADRGNQEKLFFSAVEGYKGNGLVIRSEERFRREMEGKDKSQLNDYERANDYRHVPHFPSPHL